MDNWNFYLCVAVAFSIGLVTVLGAVGPRAQAEPTKPAPIQQPVACVDYNKYYTCADAEAYAGLRSVERMMGSRAH